jgi:hypothetical protein
MESAFVPSLPVFSSLSPFPLPCLLELTPFSSFLFVCVCVCVFPLRRKRKRKSEEAVTHVAPPA